ncbi:MAG: thioredoxin domain-containing protein [Candidatus Omnitrophota bacterium]
MKFFFTALASLACALFIVKIANAEDMRWLYSYDEALNQAQQNNMAVMIDFYTDWCGWCKKLDSETYRDKKIIELSRKLVCLKVDADKNSALANKYGVRGYPTILFTDPKGKIIGGGPGFRSTDKLLSEMNSAITKH